MTIKAILRDGHIEPLEPLPPAWAEGQELSVEEPEMTDDRKQIEQWEKELDAATAKVSAEEHARFRQAIQEIETHSKDAIRREWGIS